ncbi:MAG: UTP--glucose-1-phosphate uridylyltransferase GalU [Alphaproteobacteria bacterium]
MNKPVRKAVFPVAGLGTRFLPATKAIPKEMLPIVDKPLIQYALEEAQAAGIEEFIFVTGRGKSAIADHFDRASELVEVLKARGKTAELDAIDAWMPEPGQVVFTRQREALGLGHAVWCARKLVGEEPFAVILPDDLVLADTPCLKQLIEAYGETGGNLAAVMEVPREHTNRYGILDIEDDRGRLVSVRGLVEKPEPKAAPSTLSIIGRYILQPQVMAELGRHRSGSGGEIQLTDAIGAGIGRVDFHGLRFEGRRFDCGDKIGFLEANIAFALQRPDMADAVLQAIGGLIGENKASPRGRG